MPKIIRPFSCCTCTHFDGGYTVLAVKYCSCTYIQYSGVQTVLWKCNRVKAYVRLNWDTHSLPAASGKCDCTRFSAKYRYSIDPRKRSAKGDQSAVSDAESRCGKKKRKTLQQCSVWLWRDHSATLLTASTVRTQSAVFSRSSGQFA